MQRRTKILIWECVLGIIAVIGLLIDLVDSPKAVPETLNWATPAIEFLQQWTIPTIFWVVLFSGLAILIYDAFERRMADRLALVGLDKSIRGLTEIVETVGKWPSLLSAPTPAPAEPKFTPKPLQNPESYTKYRRVHPLIVALYETLRQQDRAHVAPRAESLPADDPRRISIELLHEGPLARLEESFQDLDTRFKVAESARDVISQNDFDSLVKCSATFLVEYAEALHRWMQVGWSIWGWPDFAHEVSMPLSAPHDHLRRMLREFENRGDILEDLPREFARIPRGGFSPAATATETHE